MSTKIFWSTSVSLLIAVLTTGCAGIPVKTPTATPLPETGSIEGMMIDLNGKPIAGVGDLGYVILYCADDDPGVECLREDYEDLDPVDLLASICEITDWSGNCLVHLMTSAAEIRWDGHYIIPVVRPGQYDLILIVVSSGVMLDVHLTNVEPVEAGKVTTYDYPRE